MATSAIEPQQQEQQEQDTRVTVAATPVASAALPASPVARAIDQKALLDEVVPPSDASSASSSPPSPPPSPPSSSPSSPPPSQESSQPPATLATVARESDRPRLKVVIPPVPPFLHEVDKRNERERARRMQLTADSKRPTDAQQVDAGECANDADADADYRTPEKQIQHQPTFKRKTRGGSELDDPEQVLVFQESEYRMSQITPPPSERMLDHKNPPLPPRKTKKRRRIERPVNPITGRMTFSALPLPRLSLSSETSSSSSSSGFSMPSPPQLDTPPGSPVRMSSVFRSLADEFAAVQDTPPVRTLRPPPRITRSATRQCTPPISSRTRSAIQTPTTTMVLRSRQLNPSSKT